MKVMRTKILIGVLLLAVSCIDNEMPPTFEQQLATDTKIIDDYLAANPPANITDVVIKDASGIRLVISTLGTGTIPPNPSNNLKVAYTGRFLSTGAVFDSNNSFLLKLSDNVIQGWKIGIGMLTKGAVAKLYIPSGWAYGAEGNGSIPKNAVLVFDINLIDVVPTQAQNDRITADGNTIDAYLNTNSITAVTHPSGIRYVVTQQGGGVTPSLYDEVKVKFRATLFNDGLEVYNETYEPSSAFSSRVVNYPHGALVGMQLLPEGGKATYYVPSVLANGMQNVPANSIVVMEIEMLDVINK